MKTISSIITALLTAAINAHAFVIAVPGTEGFPIVVNSTGPVTATYQGTTAGYTSHLFLERDAFGNPALDADMANDLFIFNNHATAEGTSLLLGNYTAGSELIFRIFVVNTNENFYSGSTPNPDGLLHARVQANWMPNETLVSFEDLFGLPEGVNGFNDLSFSFTNTRNTEQPVDNVPDGGFTLAMLGSAIAGLGVMRRKLR